jgi:hypothetical protein
MKRKTMRKGGWLPKVVLGGVAILLGSSPAVAQTTFGGTGGAGATGGAGGAGAGGGFGGAGGGQGGAGGMGRTGTGTGGLTGISGGLAGGGTGGTTTAIPSASNPYRSWASSPTAVGLGTNRAIAAGNFSTSGTGTGAGSGQGFNTSFNSGGAIETLKANSMSQPLYAVATTRAAGAGGITGGLGGAGGGLGGITGIGGTTGLGTAPAGSFTTLGYRRNPSYITVYSPEPGFRPKATPPAAMQANLRAILDRSTRLPSGRNIQVAMDGPIVVLRGTATTDRERRVAEAMIRMTPGVREVRTEIFVPVPNGE